MTERRTEGVVLPNTLSSVRRAFEVLDAVAKAPGELTVRELADEIGMANSTVHRLLQSLESLDVLTKDPATRRYRLGPAILRLALIGTAEFDLRSVALPYMHRLQDLSEETIGLNVRLGDMRVYVEQLPSKHYLRTTAVIGEPYPVWSGAPGYVLLAYLEDEEVDEFLDRIEIDPPTERAPASKEQVWEEIMKVRNDGYAVAVGANNPGLANIAAPVWNDKGVVAALSISGPILRMDDERIGQIKPHLLEHAAELSQQLGHHPRMDTPAKGDPQA